MFLVSTGVYLLKHRHTTAYNSEQTRTPEAILKTKFGLSSKIDGGHKDGLAFLGVNTHSY